MRILAFGLVLLSAMAGAARADEGERLFEEKIRPILVKHCYECHSADAKNLQGKLRLDTRAGLRRGGESGPAVVPGKPDASLLIDALRYGEREMPPSGKLPESVVADFVKWVAVGAPDPRGDSTAQPGAGPSSPKPPQKIDFVQARKHWAFQPLKRPELPTVREAHWVATPVDRFIGAQLETHGLSPSPRADRRDLIRRVYNDLVGLPPTYEEVAAFARDDSPEAYAKLIDRLLDSPQYGERWARHWLDIARYADTKDGVLMFGADRIRPYAYTYRDYVIRALNEDTPFDQFVTEQLAADQMQPPVAPWRLGALGFLTLGRMFDNNLPDIYDDRIDTVSRGLLGLTVSCARCHDHKYDPVDQADYYALYGVFASSEAPFEAPLAVEPNSTPGFEEFEAKAQPVRQQLRNHLDTQYSALTRTARERVAEYLERVATTKPDPLETAVFFLSLSPDDLRPQLIARWRRWVAEHARSDDPVLGPWSELIALGDLPPEEFATRSLAILDRCRSLPPGTQRGQLNPLILEALTAAPLKSPKDVARAYGDALRRNWEQANSAATPPAPGSPARQLLDVLTSEDSPTYFTKNQAYLYMSRVPRMTFHQLQNELDKLAVQDVNAPPRAMTLVDADTLHDPRIFVRGNPAQPGDRVARRFLRVVAGDEPAPFSHGSGRIDLARAITAADNPLTARVLVNRVWMYHFGEPLVSAPSDFGMRTAPPSHPELLDWLAAELIAPSADAPAGGPWSLKRLHRTILRSNAYQQASADRPDARRIDPENRWLWRANRRRLDFEAMRDGMLAASGRLDRTSFGRPVALATDPAIARRTIYGLVDRQDLPNMYRAFDFASPDQSIERRPLTTTPQQALFAMNSPFVVLQAKAIVARPEVSRAKEDANRVSRIYRVILARDPSPEDLESALAFVRAPAASGDQLTNWEQLAQVLLLTNERLFVD